jgi:hypothetical protein
MQSDVSTSVTFLKYLMKYSHFGVVCDPFWHIRKCKVSAVHSDLSIHTSYHCCILICPWLYHSENTFWSLHKNSSWLWKLLLWRFATRSHTVLHMRLLQWGLVVFHRCAGCYYTSHGFPAGSSVEDLCCIQGVCNLPTRIHCGSNYVLRVCHSKVALVHDMRA